MCKKVDKADAAVAAVSSASLSNTQEKKKQKIRLRRLAEAVRPIYICILSCVSKYNVDIDLARLLPQKMKSVR